MPSNTPPPGWPVGEPYAPYIPSGPSTPGTDYDKNPTKNWYPNGQYGWDDPFLNGDAVTRNERYPHYWSYGDPDPNWRPSFYGETPPWNRNPNDTSGSANTQKGDWFGNTMRDKPKETPAEKERRLADYRESDAVEAGRRQADRDSDAAFWAAGGKRGHLSNGRTFAVYPPGWTGPRKYDEFNFDPEKDFKSGPLRFKWDDAPAGQAPKNNYSSGYPAQQGVSDMQTAPWNQTNVYSTGGQQGYGGGGQYGGPPMPNYGSGTSGGKPYQGPQQGGGYQYGGPQSYGGRRDSDPYGLEMQGGFQDPYQQQSGGRWLVNGDGTASGAMLRHTYPADWMQGGGAERRTRDYRPGIDGPARGNGMQGYGYSPMMEGGVPTGGGNPYQEQMKQQMQGMGGGNAYQEQMKQQMQGMGGGQARGQDFGRIAQGFGQGGGAPMDFAQGFGGADMLRNMMMNRGSQYAQPAVMPSANPYQNMMGGMGGGGGNPFQNMMGGMAGMGGGNPFRNMMGGMGGGNPFQNMMGGSNPFQNMMGRYR